MPNYRGQFTIRTTDNNPANYATNTWYINADDLTALVAAEGAIVQAYNTMRPAFPTTVQPGGHLVKWYNMADPEPRQPVREATWLFVGTLAGNPLPPEVSLCLSFQGLKVSGIPQARRRGRVYIGPLNTTSADASGRPSLATQANWENAGQDLLDASNAATTWRWQIYSRVDDGFVDVVDGWVDNEFDTQRRRGRTYTARRVFA